MLVEPENEKVKEMLSWARVSNIPKKSTSIFLSSYICVDITIKIHFLFLLCAAGER